MAVRRPRNPVATSEPVSVLSSTQDVSKIVQDTFGLNTDAIKNDLSISSDVKTEVKKTDLPKINRSPYGNRENEKKEPKEQIVYKPEGHKSTYGGDSKVKVIGLKDVRTLYGNHKLLVEKGKVYHVDPVFAEFLMKIEAVK
ncbi:hypothetical protein UFOVP755_68 [uncultured Caudovirales phage]|jgi:hypothetical protein|uniref:Uncharacterized protein n=1 Tax=uncultured Caudovirales phage TaxID=2100421 RepID=A0A6J7XBA5_9CAUD|nr:hypothetical protein UFOVP755_68 [uncultured Caudovirales phage]